MQKWVLKNKIPWYINIFNTNYIYVYNVEIFNLKKKYKWKRFLEYFTKYVLNHDLQIDF
jgi:hypothetical protein